MDPELIKNKLHRKEVKHMKKIVNNQHTREDVLKKVEGHLDELKGALLKATGHHVKGDMEMLKGKMENKQADFDIKAQELHQQIHHDVEQAKKKVKTDLTHAFA
jgi:hypothetical protein